MKPRTPYVGSGEDGARRSARIDLEEAEGLDWSDPRRDELEVSANRWEQQAYELMLDRLDPRPSFDEVRITVGNERLLAAIAILDADPHRTVLLDAEQWTTWSRYGRTTYDDEGIGTFHPAAEMDWEKWVANVDENGCGWSSTEHRMFELVAALTIPGRPVQLVGTLDSMGTWEADVLRILVEWASGGNNRDRPGRLTVEAN